MPNLDDREALKRIDRSDMRGLLVGFPDQLARARELGAQVPPDEIDGLCVCGMGGSAIGGDFLRVTLAHQGFPRPVAVVRGYGLPPSAGERTLVVAVSYSGNTEETLFSAREALRRGCPLMALTSDGELARLAQEEGFPLVRVPAGLPPRAALGYLFVPLLKSLGPRLEADLAGELDEALELARALARRYDEAGEAENPAKRLARALYGKLPIIYGSQGLTEPAARRWKTQVNENAKAPAYYDLLPELNHNELMGWAGRESAGRFVYTFLRDRGEHPQIGRRFRISRELLESRGQEVLEVESEGQGLLARLLSLTVLGDWVSFYLATLYGVDPTPVELIERLKRRLAES